MTTRSNMVATAVSLLAMPLAGFSGQEAQAPGARPATVLLAQNSPAQTSGNFRNTINGRPLENAPVSTLRTPGVSSADRAGTSLSSSSGSGPVDSTPFSGTPDRLNRAGGQVDRVDPSAGNAPATPNLDP